MSHTGPPRCPQCGEFNYTRTTMCLDCRDKLPEVTMDKITFTYPTLDPNDSWTAQPVSRRWDPNDSWTATM